MKVTRRILCARRLSRLGAPGLWWWWLLGMMGGHDPQYELFSDGSFSGSVAGLVGGVLAGFAVVWLAYQLAPKINTQIYKAPV